MKISIVLISHILQSSINISAMVNKIIQNPRWIVPSLENCERILSYDQSDGSQAAHPQIIKLYVNTECNAHCIMCDIGLKNRDSVFYQQIKKDKGALLSVEDCSLLIEEVKSYKPQIHIHGVEPLLHPNILGLISVLKRHGLYIYLVTNGILLAQHAQALIELGVDLITVSIDGPQNVHDQIRGKGVYAKAMEGIRLLRHWRSQLKKDHIKIETACTISNLNYHSLREYADMMFAGVQVDSIKFLYMSFVTEEVSRAHNDRYCTLGKSSAVNIGVVDPAKIDTDILWDQIKYLRRMFDYNRIFFNREFTNKQKLALFLKNHNILVDQNKCNIPWDQSTILANGDVIINNRCFTYKTGNIREQGFNAIWIGEHYQNFRRVLKKTGYFPTCVRCCGTYPGNPIT
jgi:MoaA/NifB/PqqE/SkfB family radical SAM enzyme